MDKVGVRIKELRKKNNMTQKELANKVNVSSQVISNWERGYTSPDHDDIAKLANVFDVSSDYILLGKEAPSVKNKNIKELLEEGELHWDGVPLTDEELITIRDLLKIVVKERIPKYLAEKEKNNKKKDQNEEE